MKRGVVRSWGHILYLTIIGLLCAAIGVMNVSNNDLHARQQSNAQQDYTTLCALLEDSDSYAGLLKALPLSSFEVRPLILDRLMRDKGHNVFDDLVRIRDATTNQQLRIDISIRMERRPKRGTDKAGTAAG